MKTYRNLLAWNTAMDLVQMVYDATRSFPQNEHFGLTAQMRKAAVSIPSNVAEGQGRRSIPEFCHFLSVAYGSLRELERRCS